MQRFVESDAPIDLAWTVGTLRHLGLGDPGIRFVGEHEVHRAAWTPEGASALRIRQSSEGFACEAWGPGAAWELERVPGLLGLDDIPSLPASHRVTDELLRRFPGVRGKSSLTMSATITANALAVSIKSA